MGTPSSTRVERPAGRQKKVEDDQMQKRLREAPEHTLRRNATRKEEERLGERRPFRGALAPHPF